LAYIVNQELRVGQRGNELRIMVVDDDASLRQLIRMMLSVEPGVEVVGEAADGESAVRLAAGLQPDGLLLDWQMPRMDGLAVLPLLRRVSPHTVVVMWSADADEALSGRALALGAAAVVDKEVSHIVGALDVMRRAAATA
jgi:DNA-binding NarL/FixJ family response regulator